MKISITSERGYQKTVEEGQKIIVKSPLKTDFSKRNKGKGAKEEKIAYVYCIVSPNNIIINMLSTKDLRKNNRHIYRTNTNNSPISIREFYFVKVNVSLILNSKPDILDQQEMNQFRNIVNNYSNEKLRKLNLK